MLHQTPAADLKRRTKRLAKMPILFVTSEAEDYQSDSLLHGLRSLLGETVVDYPQAHRLYKTLPPATRSQIRGGGFTLYGLLDDIAVDRSEIEAKVRRHFFDLVIFGSIWRNWEMFGAFSEFLRPEETVLVDGEDIQNIFPYSYQFLKDRRRLFVPRGRQYTYFKRELTINSARSTWYNLPPPAIAGRLAFPKLLRPISFSIPREKLTSSSPVKTKDFPTHIVDNEIAQRVRQCSMNHQYSQEQDYYADLQSSRFGITTRRAGWDCLRHYEIAANGAVLCFRDLDKKERTCAPHGLNPDNCIAYSDFRDLMEKVGRLSTPRYQELREGTMAWARNNTTVVRAEEFLSCRATQKSLQ